VVTILVEVGYAARNEEDTALVDGDGLVVEGPGHVSIEAEDGLVVLAMDVRHGDVDERRDGEFEEIEDTFGLMARFEEGDAHSADTDGFVHFVPSCGQDDDTGLGESVKDYFA
jgi:hypothetical protein